MKLARNALNAPVYLLTTADVSIASGIKIDVSGKTGTLEWLAKVAPVDLMAAGQLIKDFRDATVKDL